MGSYLISVGIVTFLFSKNQRAVSVPYESAYGSVTTWKSDMSLQQQSKHVPKIWVSSGSMNFHNLEKSQQLIVLVSCDLIGLLVN